MHRADIACVKQVVDENRGRKVRVRANKGRHKFLIAEGVICDSYPNIFTVKLNAQGNLTEQLVSYSYTDLLTKDVQIVLCK